MATVTVVAIERSVDEQAQVAHAKADDFTRLSALGGHGNWITL